MTALDLDGLWADCLLPVIADYYEDAGDTVAAEALRMLVSNNITPYALTFTVRGIDNFCFTARELHGELDKYHQRDFNPDYEAHVLPVVIWKHMPATKRSTTAYWKYYGTKRRAYEAVVIAHKRAKKKGLIP